MKSNSKISELPPMGGGTDSIPTSFPINTEEPTSTGSGLWLSIITIVCLVCLVVGLGGLFGMATFWEKSEEHSLGRFLGSLFESILAAGILGLAYELAVRRAGRGEEQALLQRLRRQFGRDVQEFGAALRDQMARTPLELNESVKLISAERRSEVVRFIFEELAGSREVADAVIKSTASFMGGDGTVWRDTVHSVEFREEEDLTRLGLLRLQDRISYKTILRKPIFRAALLRNADLHALVRERGNVDAFWISPRGFHDHDDKVEKLMRFEDFCVRIAGEDHRPDGVPEELEDGSTYFEYTLPEAAVGQLAMVQYTFQLVADRKAPYLHVAVPQPSIGFRVLIRNKVSDLKEIDARVFVPDASEVIRERWGDDGLEIRTSEVVLKGHGAVVLIR
jgi:hypothetical protein